jgi:cardiolipin synthase (CMP-forming)
MITKQQTPNLLSLSRVLIVIIMMVLWIFIPLLVQHFSQEFVCWIMFGLFVAGAASDFLDGYLARKWNVGTPLGAMLDQITDKLLVVTVLLFLLTHQAIGIIPVALLIMREIYVSGVREYLASQSIAVPVSRVGKWKTALQMVSIALILFGGCISDADFVKAGNFLLIATVFLALYSAYQYSRKLF